MHLTTLVGVHGPIWALSLISRHNISEASKRWMLPRRAEVKQVLLSHSDGQTQLLCSMTSVFCCSNPGLCCSLWKSAIMSRVGSQTTDEMQTLLLPCSSGLSPCWGHLSPPAKISSLLCLLACCRCLTISPADLPSRAHSCSYHSDGMAGAPPWRTSWPAPVQSSTSFDDLQDKGPAISSSENVKQCSPAATRKSHL